MSNKFLHSSMLVREKSKQIKEHLSWEASSNIIFFDSFTLDYIRLVTRLHWSTSV